MKDFDVDIIRMSITGFITHATVNRIYARLDPIHIQRALRMCQGCER